MGGDSSGTRLISTVVWRVGRWAAGRSGRDGGGHLTPMDPFPQTLFANGSTLAGPARGGMGSWAWARPRLTAWARPSGKALLRGRTAGWPASGLGTSTPCGMPGLWSEQCSMEPNSAHRKLSADLQIELRVLTKFKFSMHYCAWMSLACGCLSTFAVVLAPLPRPTRGRTVAQRARGGAGARIVHGGTPTSAWRVAAQWPLVPAGRGRRRRKNMVSS